MKRLTGLLLGALLLALGGCAAPSPPARPADFPLHAADQVVALHWRLDRQEGAVTAAGVMVPPLPADRISEVVLELIGLDRDGRIVSRGVDRVTARAFSGDAPWPFAVRLRPRGPEDRFALRVTEVTWRLMRGGN